jgi:hypothetical protein
MKVINDYNEGKIDALKAWILCKEAEKEIEKFLNEIYPEVLEEVEKMNPGEAYNGYVWENRNGKTTYDFTVDPEYVRLDTLLKARRKALTDAAKALNTGKGFFDKEHGEEIQAPPIKRVAKNSLIPKKA